MQKLIYFYNKRNQYLLQIPNTYEVIALRENAMKIYKYHLFNLSILLISYVTTISIGKLDFLGLLKITLIFSFMAIIAIKDKPKNMN